MKPPLPSNVRAVRLGLVLLLVAPMLSAQSTAPAAAPTPASSSDPKKDESKPQEMDRFVVTGSYIPSTETAVEAGASPVIRIDRQDIDQSGYTTTAELLQKTTISNANAVPISNNATGFTPAASAISLRGLGPEATLVLINGRRVAAYPVGAGGSTAFVDLNSIPLSAIENIEVLKDGASALYGADAVAGVINIKLRRGMNGSESFVSYGNTTDKDSSELVVSITSGITTDKTTAIFGVNYYQKAAIMNHDREYSANPPFLSTNSSPANLEVSRFAVANALGQSLTAPIPGVPNNAVFFFANSGAEPGNNGLKPSSRYTYSLDRSSTFNFNESSMSYPESKRAGAFASVEHKLFRTDNIRGYADFSHQNVKTENQLAPTATGDFSTPGQVDLVIPARTSSPILNIVAPSLGIVQSVTAGFPALAGTFPGIGTQYLNGTVQRLAAPGASNPFNPFNQDIADGSRARLAEFGNRIYRNETQASLITVGARGENVKGHWNVDASITYSSIRDDSRRRITSATRFNEIVNAASPIFSPGNSRYIGTTTPYNPFGYFRNPIANNKALVDYATLNTRSASQSTLSGFNFVASTNELWKLPKGPVGLAFGGDFRHEQLEQDPDSLALGGNVAGEAPAAATNAQRKIGGVFAEIRVPLLHNLEARGSVRYEKFFTSHREATVPKVSLRYLPFGNQLTLRSSYSEGFREPSLYELYSAPISSLFPVQDPRDGFIETEQPITLAGNRRLEAEKTNYFNVGFVWSPTTRSFKGLSLGVDHWRVNRRGTVEGNPQDTVYRAFGVLPGGLEPGESVFFSPSGFISIVNAKFFNVGRTRVEGYDFSGGYQLPTDNWGRWELTSVWTRTTRFERAAAAGAPLRSVLGSDSSGTGNDGYLKWKGRVNLSWAYKGFNVYVSGTQTDGFTDRDLNGNPFEVDSNLTVMGQVSYAFRSERQRWLRDTKVTFGVRDLFNQDPPQSIGGGGNSAGYPSFIYTSENRFWYMSVNRKF